MGPAFRYHESSVSPSLRCDVDCAWTGAVEVAIPQHRILPDGCVDLMIGWDGDGKARASVVGTMTRAVSIGLSPGERFVAVRLLPGFVARWLRCDASELTDREVPLSEIAPRVAAESASILESRGSSHARERLEAVLEREVCDLGRRSVAQEIAAQIVEKGGSAAVLDAAVRAGYSARQLQRLFVREVGIPPKLFARIVRFRQAERLARAHPQWRGSEIAQRCGYFDQSHWIRERRAFDRDGE